MSLLTLILFVIGLILLIVGAEALVRGAARLAAAAGISPLVIGLTVVAFGTSSPELAVSLQSGLQGQADIALGNVVGSNIFNVLFIIGLAAAITPLIVAQQLVRLDVPLMIGLSFLLWVLSFDGKIGRLDGLLLVSGVVAYTTFLIHQSRRANQLSPVPEFSSQIPSASKWPINLGLVVIGLGLLVLGSRWLVDGAVELAKMFGLSELIIGLTIVAAGTSLPEVATSVVASLRGERDIAVGNAIGSNIFNIMAVLGLTSLFSPNGITVSPAALSFNIPVMIAVALVTLPIFFSGFVIARWEGLLFLGYYLAYTLYLILNAADSSLLPTYNAVMLAGVIPLTILVLVANGVRALKLRPIWPKV